MGKYVFPLKHHDHEMNNKSRMSNGERERERDPNKKNVVEWKPVQNSKVQYKSIVTSPSMPEERYKERNNK